MKPNSKISIVSTLYYSEKHIFEFYRRCRDSVSNICGDWEIILVNDGSPDASLAYATELAQLDEHVTVVDLSRNFGHHKAMMTGLSYATGEYIFLIDSDLEEDPELISTFIEKLLSENVDVVFGVQKKRRGNISEKISGMLFYKIFRSMTGIQQPDNILTVRLMTKRYVNSLLRYGERELNIGALWISTGYEQRSIQVEKKSTSQTTYNFSAKVYHLVNAITSFSNKPLNVIFYFGMYTSIAAVIYIIYLIFSYFVQKSPSPGYTSIIASVWLFSGIIIFFMGVIGIYLSKIFIEVKQRPYSIVRDIIKKNPRTEGENDALQNSPE